MVSKYNLILRKVTKNDEDLLFNWANDSDTRKWSFNSLSITLDEHKFWLNQKITDENILFWILELSNTPVGLVRLEKKENIIILNYQIAPEFRGKGLASKMLTIAMTELNNYWKNIKVLAYTLPGNIASIKSLTNAGFILESSSSEKKCYIFNAKSE